MSKGEEDRSVALRQLWEREKKFDQWKSRWPLFSLGALAVVLVMSLTLPNALGTTKFTCELMVAYTWTTTGTGICVRYNE